MLGARGPVLGSQSNITTLFGGSYDDCVFRNVQYAQWLICQNDRTKSDDHGKDLADDSGRVTALHQPPARAERKNARKPARQPGIEWFVRGRTGLAGQRRA